MVVLRGGGERERGDGERKKKERKGERYLYGNKKRPATVTPHKYEQLYG